MTDFLLELRSEEIPARMQAGARVDLEKLFAKEMNAAGVAPGAITVWSTPRRLALIAHDLPDATEAVSEELKGPKLGAPPQDFVPPTVTFSTPAANARLSNTTEILVTGKAWATREKRARSLRLFMEQVAPKLRHLEATREG